MKCGANKGCQDENRSFMSRSKLVNAVIVFVAPDARRTAEYYRDALGFRVVEHFDKAEAFSALYRGEVEIVVVQTRYGDVVCNQERYGAHQRIA